MIMSKCWAKDQKMFLRNLQIVVSPDPRPKLSLSVQLEQKFESVNYTKLKGSLAMIKLSI